MPDHFGASLGTVIDAIEASTIHFVGRGCNNGLHARSHPLTLSCVNKYKIT
jgi:hypothetical protein